MASAGRGGKRANRLTAMWGRYPITTIVEALRRLSGFKGAPNLQPRLNLAPSQPAPALRLNARRGRALRHGRIVGSVDRSRHEGRSKASPPPPPPTLALTAFHDRMPALLDSRGKGLARCREPGSRAGIAEAFAWFGFRPAG
jgi:hypothetical protein